MILKRLWECFQTIVFVGLSKELLENESPLDEDTVLLLKLFLKRLPTPICLVAHNGRSYDFVMLRKHMEAALPNDIYCLDSLRYFRCMEKSSIASGQIAATVPTMVVSMKEEEAEHRPKTIADFFAKKKTNNSFARKPLTEILPKKVARRSLKLDDIFKRLFEKSPQRKNNAEYDAETLLKCAIATNCKFVEFAEKNCDRFFKLPEN
ncbi:uncharacterized protein LOC131434408 [Malaya genurostris]|uniref:uncharacterized protein LOC131434408 n=1 Tax=Malaya genurostris TaxID=325434 RepID=UPI0026F3F22C|nr:uncharacterized protein LOC131434408 [Malaya genurostris]